jgi:hypothetical protein
MDGSGVFFNPDEPIHLDALLSWALMPFHYKGEPPGRDDRPLDVPLPLGKWHKNGEWGWHASALFPDGETAESLQFWRKRFRQSKMEYCKGNPNLKNGIYREYNVPMPLILCHRLVCYALGSKKRVKQILKKQVKYIGKKKAYGKGMVVGVDVEIIDKDLSLVSGGNAQRYLPVNDGDKHIRPRPPYWNNVGRVECCRVGDIYDS